MELTLPSPSAFAAAHRHFARAVLWLYVGAASVALSALVWGLLTDRRYDEERCQQRLLLETQARARYLGNHLRLLAEELRRLGLRSEVDLLDDNLGPERSLLELAHGDSTFFNLGVGILDARGSLVWAQPSSFLDSSRSFARAPWFASMRLKPGISIVAIDPSARDAFVYVVAPIVRAGYFGGAIVGGIDLSRTRPLGGKEPENERLGESVLTTATGEVIFPGVPPEYATSASWQGLFSQASLLAPIHTTLLDGRPRVVATASVGQTGLNLATVIDREELLSPAAQRLRTRLLLVLSFTIAPLLGLVYLFNRSLKAFQRAEDAAVREDRLRRLGEASNSIAHEIRNSLNGLRVGLDLILQGKRAASDRVVTELRAEIERLSDFTHQLMLFAKDPNPNKTRADLSQVVKTALSLTCDLSDELGVEIEVLGTEAPVLVDVDPTLIRIVLSNLISNSLDALSTLDAGRKPRLTVAVERTRGAAKVCVTDNGPGVPKSLATNLFEPFVTGKASGVGIGLALARKIARAHGGDLRQLDIADGASFVLELAAGAT